MDPNAAEIGYADKLSASLKSLFVQGYGAWPKRMQVWIFHLFFFWKKDPATQQGSRLPGLNHWAAAFAWWWVGFVFKSLDLLIVPEWADLITQLLNRRARRLTSEERVEAEKVFSKHLNWNQVRLLEGSRIAKAGKWQAGSESMAVCVGHVIHFSRRITCTPGSRDMRWLVHELTHVVQMERVGSVYIPESLFAQRNGGYEYGGIDALTGRSFSSFNREQQAEICADYYRKVEFEGGEAGEYPRMIAEMQQGLV